MGKRGDGKGAWEEGEEERVFYRFPVEEESSLANKMRPGRGRGKRKASTQARRGRGAGSERQGLDYGQGEQSGVGRDRLPPGSRKE